MTPRGKQRLMIIIAILISLAVAATLAFYALREDVMYFQSPSDVMLRQTPPGQQFRLGGRVAKGSIEKLPGQITRFTVTDMQHNLQAEYQGILPDLFREDQGVVMDGALGDNNIFVASRVLAKHDENYMPPQTETEN